MLKIYHIKKTKKRFSEKRKKTLSVSPPQAQNKAFSHMSYIRLSFYSLFIILATFLTYHVLNNSLKISLKTSMLGLEE